MSEVKKPREITYCAEETNWVPIRMREVSKAEDAAVEAMYSVLAESIYWLHRMSELKWDDPEYAPRFKRSFESQCEALRAYDLAKSQGKGEAT